MFEFPKVKNIEVTNNKDYPIKPNVLTYYVAIDELTEQLEQQIKKDVLHNLNSDFCLISYFTIPYFDNIKRLTRFEMDNLINKGFNVISYTPQVNGILNNGIHFSNGTSVWSNFVSATFLLNLNIISNEVFKLDLSSQRDYAIFHDCLNSIIRELVINRLIDESKVSFQITNIETNLVSGPLGNSFCKNFNVSFYFKPTIENIMHSFHVHFNGLYFILIDHSTSNDRIKETFSMKELYYPENRIWNF